MEFRDLRGSTANPGLGKHESPIYKNIYPKTPMPKTQKHIKAYIKTPDKHNWKP